MNSKMKILSTCLVTFSLAAAGCSQKHGEVPAPLSVSVPPSVTNLDVQNPQSFDYDITWTHSDPSQVNYYRLYASLDGQTFELVEDTIPATPVPVFVPVTSPVPVATFGVSTVGLDNVEGGMVRKDAP